MKTHKIVIHIKKNFVDKDGVPFYHFTEDAWGYTQMLKEAGLKEEQVNIEFALLPEDGEWKPKELVPL